MVSKHNARSIAWEEVFDGGFTLQNDTVVNVWLSSDELANIVRSGYDVIYSYGWYLDQQTPAGGTHYFWCDALLLSGLAVTLRSRGNTPTSLILLLGVHACALIDHAW